MAEKSMFVYTVWQINLLIFKFYWSTGFPNFQPIKMQIKARRCSIVIGRKFGKSVLPKNLEVLQINLQNRENGLGLSSQSKKKPFQFKTGFLHFILSCSWYTWGTSRQQLVAKNNQHPCREETENVRWICQKWRRQKTSPWEWSSLEEHFRFHQRWR